MIEARDREGPEVNVGVLVAHSPAADAGALAAFAERLTGDARRELEAASGASWAFDVVDPARLSSDDPHRPSDFLDEASLRMVEGPYDLVVVVTDVALTSRKHAVVAGVPSEVARTIVLSTRKLLVTPRGTPVRSLDSEAVRWNAAALLLHLAGHALGVPVERAGGDAMAPFAFDASRDRAPAFSGRSRERLRARVRKAPQKEWADPGVVKAAALSALAGVRHADLVARALWRNRAPFLPLALPRLATAAVVPTFILVFTAEIWDVGLNLPDGVAWSFALASILIATAYLVVVQNLFFPRKERRVLTEYMAVVNVTVFLTMLLATLGLFVLVIGLMLVIEVAVFPPDLISTWPTLEDPVVDTWDKVRLAAFISTVGVLTGALGGGLESRLVLRHLALFRDTP